MLKDVFMVVDTNTLQILPLTTLLLEIDKNHTKSNNSRYKLNAKYLNLDDNKLFKAV